MDDHITVSPNPAQAPSEKETDSGLEEPVTYEQEEKETNNESENQGIDVVVTSTSDQEEIIIDPTTIETYSRGVCKHWHVKWATKPTKKSNDYKKKKLQMNTIIIKRRKR